MPNIEGEDIKCILYIFFYVGISMYVYIPTSSNS